MSNDQRGYTPGTEFLDARHAQRDNMQAGAISPQAGRVIECGDLRDCETKAVRPFGTGGMIDRIGNSLSRLETMFKQLEVAIEPTLERAGEPTGGAAGNTQAVQVPNTEHGEALYEIESRIDSLTRRMNAVGARVRL